MEKLYFNNSERKTTMILRTVKEHTENNFSVLYLTDNKDNFRISNRMERLNIDLSKVNMVFSSIKDISTVISESEEGYIILDIEDCVTIPDVGSMVYLYYNG